MYNLFSEDRRLEVDGCPYCFASGKVTVEHRPVGYMYRETPTFGGDSGWRFFAGSESERYLANTKNFQICSLNDILKVSNDIASFLTASVGSSFIRSQEGRFVVFASQEPESASAKIVEKWQNNNWTEKNTDATEGKTTYVSEISSYAQKVVRHCVQYIGKKYEILHMAEMDFLLIYPQERNRFYTIVTLDMGTREMQMPAELKPLMLSRAELLICLSGQEKIENELQANGKYGFVLEMLEQIALAPFLSGNWLGYGHTIPNDHPVRPYSTNTKLCASILDTPRMFEKNFAHLFPDPKTKVHFYTVVPVYKEEMEWKARKGPDEVLERLYSQCGYLLNLTRRNIAKRKMF